MSFLFSPSAQKNTPPTSPQFGGLRVQSSAFGLCVGVLYGINRVSGNMIDWKNFAAHAQTSQENQGGKGGPDVPSQTTWYYTTDWLMSFGEGPWHGIRRIWKGKEQDSISAYNIFLGDYPQAVSPFSEWGYYYPGIVALAQVGCNLGNSDTLAAISVEGVGRLPWTGTWERVDDALIVLPQETPWQESYTIADPYEFTATYTANFSYDAGVAFVATGVKLTRIEGNAGTHPAIETYLVAAPGTHTVSEAATFDADLGVYYQTQGGIYLAQENYTVAGAGTYTVAQAAQFNGEAGVYFETTDRTDPAEEFYTVASPGTKTVDHAADFDADIGVYFQDTGQFLTKVSGTPLPGQYTVTAGVYTFCYSGGGLLGGGAGDTGRVVGIKYYYQATIPGAELTKVTGAPSR